MYGSKTVSVVVPAHNEERLIIKTISTMPEFIDKIIVVNDCSKDKTQKLVEDYQKKDSRVILINHLKNTGVGKTLIDGYLKSVELNMDIAVVMAGDAQMDPADLPAVLEPIVSGKADYVKGIRLLVKDVAKVMPTYRFYGNALLSLLSKFASGYWHVIDPVCGYTAITKKALEVIDISKMYPGYGYPVDILTRLNIFNFKVADVTVKPVYGEEVSGIKLRSYIPKVSCLFVRLFFYRLWEKYAVRDFHPLIFFLFGGIIFTLLGGILGAMMLYVKLTRDVISVPTAILFTLLIGFGFQSLCLGIWLDMDYNKSLNASRD